MMDSDTGTALVATVGTGRDREDIATAIVFSVRRSQAGRAVFLCSAKTKAETLPLVLHKLDWPGERYRVDVCGDENDVQALFGEWNCKWDQFVGDWAPQRVIVDFTSGTKAMSAAAVMLGLARGAETLAYVTGPRDDTGRVVRSEDIRQIAPDAITAWRRLRLAVDHFHAGSFAAAVRTAEPYVQVGALPDERLCAIAGSIHAIGCAYEAWNRFDYKRAASGLHESRRHWPDWKWVSGIERLEANAVLIKAVRKHGDTLTPALAADLLASTDRCMKRAVWDDAVARLYRACELLAQMKLTRDHRIKSGDVNVEALPERCRAEYADKREHSPDGRLRLGLYESYRLLEQLADPLGTSFIARYGKEGAWGPLKGLLDSRNQSLLAHGTVPIGEEKARELREYVHVLASETDPTILTEWLPKTEPVAFGPF